MKVRNESDCIGHSLAYNNNTARLKEKVGNQSDCEGRQKSLENVSVKHKLLKTEIRKKIFNNPLTGRHTL